MEGMFVDAGDWLRVNLALFGTRLLGAVAILLVGLLAARLAGAAARRAMLRTPLRSRGLLVNFLTRTVRTVVVVFAGVVALGELGLDIGPLIAGIGITGFVVGFAFKDSLSNLAAGLLLLFYQPFEVGDFVDAGGQTGSVRDMSIAATELKLPDGRLAIVPNSKIWNAAIVNYNRLGMRRIEWTMGVPYAADIGRAMQALRDALAADPRVLADPAPEFVVTGISDSKVELAVRGWVAPGDVGEATSDVRLALKATLDAMGA